MQIMQGSGNPGFCFPPCTMENAEMKSADFEIANQQGRSRHLETKPTLYRRGIVYGPKKVFGIFFHNHFYAYRPF